MASVRWLIDFHSVSQVWAWALTLHELLETQGALPHELVADAKGLRRVRDTLYKTSFEGLDGTVGFEQATGDRLCSNMAIENQQSGVEVTVGNTDCTGAFIDRPPHNVQWWSNLDQPSKPAFDAPPPLDGSENVTTSLFPPDLLSVTPPVGDPLGGQTVLLSGNHFRAGVLLITFDGRLCTSPTLLSPGVSGVGGVGGSPGRISCVTPAGVGEGALVHVSIGGLSGKPKRSFGYAAPIIRTISREWLWHGGSDVYVWGDNFVAGKT